MSELSRIQEALREITSPRMFEELHTAAAVNMHRLVMEGFDEERDPYGIRWRPSLRARLEGGHTLIKSGRLRQSFTWRADAKGAQVGTNVVYAPTHQFGRDGIAQRRMLPTTTGGMPPAWERELSRSMEAIIRKRVRP